MFEAVVRLLFFPDGFTWAVRPFSCFPPSTDHMESNTASSHTQRRDRVGMIFNVPSLRCSVFSVSGLLQTRGRRLFNGVNSFTAGFDSSVSHSHGVNTCYTRTPLLSTNHIGARTTNHGGES